jgi:hypothetical protein
MDILKALRDLYNEKKRLDVAISSLEARVKAVRKGSTTKPSQGRRGRKSMSAAERQEVSKRMTLYWEARRAQARPSEVSPQSPSDAPSTSEEQQASSTSA